MGLLAPQVGMMHLQNAGMRASIEDSVRVPAIQLHPLYLMPCMQWHGTSYLGAAHGLVGILYTLLAGAGDAVRQLDGEVRELLLLVCAPFKQSCFASLH